MIKLIAVLTVKPEFCGVIETKAWDLVKVSRCEKGNISYNFVKDSCSDNKFIFLEEWKDQNAVDSHNNSEHFQTICPQLHDMCSDMTLYRVDM